MREFKVTKVQLKQAAKPQYITTIPVWIVVKVLQAKKGDKLFWDFRGKEVAGDDYVYDYKSMLYQGMDNP